MSVMAVRGVIFDLGGVVLDSPFPAIAAYERELNVPPHSVGRAISRGVAGGSWGRLERCADRPHC